MPDQKTADLTAAAFDALSDSFQAINRGDFDAAERSTRNASNLATEALKTVGYLFVPETRFTALASAIEKLNRRAAKLGQAPVGCISHGHDIRRVTDDLDFWRRRAYVMVSLVGQAPVVNGAKLLARIEHTAAGNIVSAAPGVTADPAWHAVDARCEHCNTDRRRNDTFAVEIDGTVKLVGRNCLADFVRSTDVESALVVWRFLELYSAAAGASDDEWSSGGCSYAGPTPQWFVACAAKSIRQHGFRKRDQDSPTASQAAFAAGQRPMTHEGREAWELAQPDDCDVALAARAMAWIAQTTETYGFIANCRVVAQLSALEYRHYGIAAAIPQAYRREQEKTAKAAAPQAKTVDAGFFGEIGKRYDLSQLRVMTVRAFDGNYGTTTLVKLADTAGHSFTWFASGVKNFEPGMIVSGKATVKKHDASERFGRQTVLSRCTFEPMAGEQA